MPAPLRHGAGRREDVWQLLRVAGRSMSIAEIAEQLGIHANTARFHLDTLVNHGQVERTTAEPGAPGRPPQLFQSVRGMDPRGPRHYRVLAEVLAASLAGDPDPGHRSVHAGRVWGHRQGAAVADQGEAAEKVDAAGAVGRLTVMLAELGFAPETHIGGDSAQIGLRSCPFLELAVDRSEVVCAVHLGLMQGAMKSWDAPVTVHRLDPFVEPDLCVAHLSTREAS